MCLSVFLFFVLVEPLISSWYHTFHFTLICLQFIIHIIFFFACFSKNFHLNFSQSRRFSIFGVSHLICRFCSHTTMTFTMSTGSFEWWSRCDESFIYFILKKVVRSIRLKRVQSERKAGKTTFHICGSSSSSIWERTFPFAQSSSEIRVNFQFAARLRERKSTKKISQQQFDISLVKTQTSENSSIFFSLSQKKSLLSTMVREQNSRRCWQFWLQKATKRLRSNHIKFY